VSAFNTITAFTWLAEIHSFCEIHLHIICFYRVEHVTSVSVVSPRSMEVFCEQRVPRTDSKNTESLWGLTNHWQRLLWWSRS